MVEPSFMDYKVRKKIDGSERTILALVRDMDGEIYGAEGGHDRVMAMALKKIDQEARETAAGVLASIKTASCVLAPGFAEKFADTIGPDLLVALPTRNQLLVFSRQDQAFEKMGEYIISGYLGSNYPVSREIFSLENGRLRSLGVLQ